MFFTSGSEIGFYQEAIAKARGAGPQGAEADHVTHEHASLNAALGYAAVSGKPAVTAAHVDCGTQHYGGAVHTALHAGLPVLITGRRPPTGYPGSIRGARDAGGHIWLQQSFDQNGIVRQYTKWDHRMEFQDNPGLMVSRALQVACTEPCGPVYLSLPREVSLAQGRRREVSDAGSARRARSPRRRMPDGIREIARAAGRAPKIRFVRGALGPQSGDGAGAGAAVRAARAAGRAVGLRAYMLSAQPSALPGETQSGRGRRGARARRRHALDAGTERAQCLACVAITDVEPAKRRIPTMEFTPTCG